MRRICLIFITALLFLQCNNIQKKASNEILKDAELSLDNDCKVLIVTTIDTINQKVTNQKLSFWDGDNRVKEINPDTFSFVNSLLYSYINQVSQFRLGDRSFYLLCLNLANGEPEYYVALNSKGEITAYKICTRSNCQTTLMQNSNQSKEVIDFFQNDTISVDFKDVF